MVRLLIYFGLASVSAQAAAASVEPRCLEALAALAVKNPRAIPLPAIVARPLGLSNPFLTRQLLVKESGVTHIVAVDSGSWRTAIVAKKAEGKTHFFIVNRLGQLVRGVVVESSVVSLLDLSDPLVVTLFNTEVIVWSQVLSPIDNLPICRGN